MSRINDATRHQLRTMLEYDSAVGGTDIDDVPEGLFKILKRVTLP